ncbi:hypothetical protein OSTOST_01473 [Ostertagia ostertagi]
MWVTLYLLSSLPLSQSDKELIGHHLKLGLNIPTIVNIVRKQHCDPGRRLYWICAADIRNVQESLHLLPGRLHKDDVESVRLRFNLNVTSDGMRLLRLPAETDHNFRLVIITPEQVEIMRMYSAKGISIDDTHCTTRYNLKLATMMCVDDYGRGVPCAFLLSNKIDTVECAYLFEEDERSLIAGKYRAKENSRRHRTAIEHLEQVHIQKIAESEWVISSFSRTSRYYRITTAVCNCGSEKLHCPLCGVCPAATLCSCPDSVKSGISCKHAHAWAVLNDGKTSRSVDFLRSPPPFLGSGPVSDFAVGAELADDNNNVYEGNDSTSHIPTEEIDLTKSVIATISEVRGAQRAARRELKMACDQDFSPAEIDLNAIQVCAICNEMQPELDDSEEEVMVGAVIDWWACEKCYSWVHRDCMLESSCNICSGRYRPTEELTDPIFVHDH